LGSAAELPPSTEQVCSPYDPRARYSSKRDIAWVGYKVQVTETCDPACEGPHVITSVETTPATTPDDNMVAVIAALLTQEGFRSPRHSQVLVNTTSAIRRRNRILQAPSHPRRLPGWLTVSQLAQQLGIPRRWIDQRIRSGVIVVGPHPPMKLHLVPNTEATDAGFRSLRAGQVCRLRFDHLAEKQEHQRA